VSHARAVDRPRLASGDWGAEAKAAPRRWATVLLIGVACGVVVTGVLSRLVMFLLAELNPEAAGVRSDDGFIMGQITLSGSTQLALAGAQLGAVGAFLYMALRGLMIGPPWFRLLSISVGPGVVVGAMLVHTTGIDFHLLHPLWLTIGSFVLLPVVFCAAMHLMAERALRQGGVRSMPLQVLGVTLSIVALPLTLVLGIGWLVARALRSDDTLSTTVAAWFVRAVLALVFVVSVIDLVSDARTLSTWSTSSNTARTGGVR
jgi:hypothetical protein